MLHRVLIICLVGLLFLPFVLTQMIFSCRKERQQRGRFWIGTALNLLGNGAFLWGLLSWRFQTRTPWQKLRSMLRMQCTYQDASTLGTVMLVCVALGILGGLLLRALLYGRNRERISQGRRLAVVGLASVCVLCTIAARGIARQSVHQLRIVEVYRKVSDSRGVSGVISQGSEKTEEVSCVMILNPGPMNCAVSEIWLSDTEDDLNAVCFRNVVVRAGETRGLIMDYDRGIDLEKSGTSVVYLSDGQGKVIDRVNVPGLQENESYRQTQEGAWEIESHGPVHREFAVEMPRLSAQSGFSEQSFWLEITGPEGAEIHYTLDGSIPTAGSSLYTEPLLIQDRTPEENRWSVRTDVSARFLTEDNPYRVPGNPVDKCTIVRAVCVNEEGQTSDTVTASYFVGYKNREGYQNLRVVSIVTDPENLFDAEKGIYVLGNTFQSEYDAETDRRSFLWWAANYHMKGKLWEREADIQIFDPDTSLALNKRLGVRIKGYSSSARLPKGLNLYAREEYDGESTIQVDLFETGYQAGRISISMGGNDTSLKVRDWLMTRLAGDFGVLMPHYEPCCVFLDGEHWGAGWLAEQINEQFIRYYENADTGTVAIIKHGELDTGDASQGRQWQAVVDYLTKTDLSDSNCYAKAGEIIDLENTMKYFALEIYAGNTDWLPYFNTMAWRITGSQGTDDRWKWALFDVNHTSVFHDLQTDHLTQAMEKCPLFAALMKNKEFSREFYKTLKMLAEDVFAPQKTAEALTEYREMMGAALQLDHLRFYGEEIDMGQLDEMQLFFEQRAEYILAECEARLAE